MEEFANRMQFSGYGEVFRELVLTSALKSYDKMIERDKQEIESLLYRPKDWRSVERAEEKRVKKSELFHGKEGKNETVLFVPATSESELKKRYQKTVQKGTVLGISVKRKVQKSDLGTQHRLM